MRIASILMFVLSLVFIVVKVLASLAMAYIPSSDNMVVYILQYGQIALGVILHVFIAVVLLQVKENPIRAVSYFLYVAMGIFSTVMANIIATYLQPNMITFWSAVSALNSILLINLVIQSHLIKNTFLKPAYVIQAWSMVASTLVFLFYPYLVYYRHQTPPIVFPSFFNAFTEIALAFLIFRIYQYFNSIDYQKELLKL